MVNVAADAHAAPGRLEDVRALLNTWLIPNDTRIATDRLDEFAEQHGLGDRKQLRRLRDDLRAAVEGAAETADVLNRWIARLGLRPHVDGDLVVYRHDGGLPGDLVASCVDALAAGRWDRLKACPDCRWVFYDHTRNASKRWCRMTAGGPGGRSCGGLAKVRAFRQRAKGRTADAVGPGG